MAGRRAWGKIRKLPSGNFQASYVGPDMRRHVGPVSFQARIDAESWLGAERRLIEREEWQPPAERSATKKRQSTTLGEFAKSWMADRELKPRTRAHYGRLLDRLILPHLGPRPLSALTADDVDAWYRTLNNGTPTLRAHAYGLLRTILGTAVDRRLLATNPCKIRGAGYAKRAHKVEPLTIAQLATLTEAMPERHQLAVLLAAWCALRYGEIAELRRRDIDVTNGRVKVRRGVVELTGGSVVGAPKSDAGIRDVTVPPHLLPLIKAHLARHAEPGRDGLLFPAERGGNLPHSTFYGKSPTRVKVKGKPVEWAGGRGFYRARAVAGHPDMHFHDLRHSGAVLAAQTGATLAELMSRLGHSTPGAAMRYQHAAKDRDKEIAAALSRMVEVAGG